MYFVDQTLLEKRLVYVEQQLRFLAGVSSATTEVERLAVERAIHMCIEAMLDIGNQMIDGFIMRDPGSYEDIITILNDEQVISKQEKDALIRFISLRRRLVAEYTELQFPDLWAVYQQTSACLSVFPQRIREYLTSELGPVSAFSPPETEQPNKKFT